MILRVILRFQRGVQLIMQVWTHWPVSLDNSGPILSLFKAFSFKVQVQVHLLKPTPGPNCFLLLPPFFFFVFITVSDVGSMMIHHGSSVSRPRGMTGVGSLRNHHRQILQLWTDLHCSRLCLGGTPCPWWGCPKPVGIVQGRSLWVSEMDPKSHCCQKVADVSCLLKVGFASSLRNFPLPWLHRYWARVVWRKKQHQTTKGQLLQILQPGCFKTKGWNQLRLPGYRCKIFRILNTFLDLPTLPQQVVAKLKQATLEMLGEGADAAQKMTRMINPEVGQVWFWSKIQPKLVPFAKKRDVEEFQEDFLKTIFKPFSNHLKSPSIPAFFDSHLLSSPKFPLDSSRRPSASSMPCERHMVARWRWAVPQKCRTSIGPNDLCSQPSWWIPKRTSWKPGKMGRWLWYFLGENGWMDGRQFHRYCIWNEHVDVTWKGWST